MNKEIIEKPSKFWIFSQSFKTINPISEDDLWLYKYNNYWTIYEDTRYIAKLRLYNYLMNKSF